MSFRKTMERLSLTSQYVYQQQKRIEKREFHLSGKNCTCECGISENHPPHAIRKIDGTDIIGSPQDQVDVEFCEGKEWKGWKAGGVGIGIDIRSYDDTIMGEYHYFDY